MRCAFDDGLVSPGIVGPPPQLHFDSPPDTLHPDGRVRAAAVNFSRIMSPDALSTPSQEKLPTRDPGAPPGDLAPPALQLLRQHLIRVELAAGETLMAKGEAGDAGDSMDLSISGPLRGHRRRPEILQVSPPRTRRVCRVAGPCGASRVPEGLASYLTNVNFLHSPSRQRQSRPRADICSSSQIPHVGSLQREKFDIVVEKQGKRSADRPKAFAPAAA
jgi:hypothetical protein